MSSVDLRNYSEFYLLGSLEKGISHRGARRSLREKLSVLSVFSVANSFQLLFFNAFFPCFRGNYFVPLILQDLLNCSANDLFVIDDEYGGMQRQNRLRFFELRLGRHCGRQFDRKCRAFFLSALDQNFSPVTVDY